MRPLRPGKYRHRITFQQRVETRDPDTGAVSVKWADVHTNMPAEVLTGPGREASAANTKLAETAARINVRYFSGLDSKWRVVWLSHIYNITSVEMDETGVKEYRLRCSAGLTDGR